MANAVNFIDGLDGLAAGIVAIAAGAFFVYSHQLFKAGQHLARQLRAARRGDLPGLCLGFLPHNFHPARIFMGDAGAMLLGLLMAASTLSVVGQTDNPFSGRTYFFFAPIFIPFFILGIPMLDTAFAIVRRAGRRGNPAKADKDHLHHRLMRLGHGQRRVGAHPLGVDGAAVGLVLYPTFTNTRATPSSPSGCSPSASPSTPLRPLRPPGRRRPDPAAGDAARPFAARRCGGCRARVRPPAADGGSRRW